MFYLTFNLHLQYSDVIAMPYSDAISYNDRFIKHYKK